MSLTDTLPTDWRYLSEGGATIVLSYNGPTNPFFDRTVLRLRKTALAAQNTEHASEDDPAIEFQTKCIERLIPPAYLPRLESVTLGRAWLMKLAASCESDRPLERRQKDCIDVNRQKGVVATDLVGGPGIAVEIKPKWGFLPSATYLSDATRPIKTRTCRFCMHAYLKAQQGDVASLGYCPLNLFSGDEACMRTALNNLWDAWVASDGAVNNLKVFVHGKKIGPTEQSAIAGLTGVADPKDGLTAALLTVLAGSPVLRTLARLQRRLDSLDIEGLAALRGISPVGADPTIAEWSAFISAYLAAPLPPADAPHLRHHVLAHLLSATFKDCSIIVRVPDRTVTVIDLDPKGVDRLAKWERLDRDIVSAYVAVPDPKVCADANCP